MESTEKGPDAEISAPDSNGVLLLADKEESDWYLVAEDVS